MRSRISSRAFAFVDLLRPQFLFGAALFYALGAAAAVAGGVTIDWGRYWIGQAMVTSIQLLTHFANEYFDVESDRKSVHRTWLTGGSGVLADGRLSEGVAIRAAAVSAVLGGILVIWAYVLVPAAGLLGVVALLAGWFYSAPPLKLEGSGFGEAVAALVVAVMVPVVAAVLQDSTVPGSLWWVVAGLALLQFAMLIAFSLPDLEADRDSGKLVLAARLGRPRARVVQTAALAIGFVVLAIGAPEGEIIPLVWALMIAALAAGIVQAVVAGTNRYVVLTTSAAMTLLMAAAAATIYYLVGV